MQAVLTRANKSKSLVSHYKYLKELVPEKKMVPSFRWRGAEHA